MFRIGNWFRSGWQWVGHISNAQWLFAVLAPAGTFGAVITWIAARAAHEPLWWLLSLFFVLAGSIAFFLLIGTIWINELKRRKLVESGLSQSESISKIDRISIFQLRELVKKVGWPSNPDDAEWIKFTLMLRQAFVDGNMTAWGRKNISTADDVVAAEPLVLIPSSHWEGFQIDVISLRNASQSIDVHTYNQNVVGWALRQGYRDLHVSENEARAVISEFGKLHSARIMAEAATTIAENAKDEKRTRARDRMRRIAEGRE